MLRTIPHHGWFCMNTHQLCVGDVTAGRKAGCVPWSPALSQKLQGGGREHAVQESLWVLPCLSAVSRENWDSDVFSVQACQLLPTWAQIQAPVTSLLSCVTASVYPGVAESECSWCLLLRHWMQQEQFPWATWKLTKLDLTELKHLELQGSNIGRRHWQDMRRTLTQRLAPHSLWFLLLLAPAVPLPGPVLSRVLTEATQGQKIISKPHQDHTLLLLVRVYIKVSLTVPQTLDIPVWGSFGEHPLVCLTQTCKSHQVSSCCWSFQAFQVAEDFFTLPGRRRPGHIICKAQCKVKMQEPCSQSKRKHAWMDPKHMLGYKLFLSSVASLFTHHRIF